LTDSIRSIKLNPTRCLSLRNLGGTTHAEILASPNRAFLHFDSIVTVFSTRAYSIEPEKSYEAYVGTGEHVAHSIYWGSNCGQSWNQTYDQTRYGSTIALVSSLSLIKIGPQWLPAEATETRTSTYYAGPATFTSKLDSSGVVTTIESGSATVFDFQYTVSSTEVLDLNSGAFTFNRATHTSGSMTGIDDAPCPYEDHEIFSSTATLPITLTEFAGSPDLSIQKLAVIQNGQPIIDIDGDGIIDFKAGTASEVTVEVVGNLLPQNPGLVGVTFEQETGSPQTKYIYARNGTENVTFPFVPTRSGLQNLTARVQTVTGETNLSNNTATIQVDVKPQIMLLAEAIDGDVIKPSVVACATASTSPYSRDRFERKSVKIRCVDRAKMDQPVEGCTFLAKLVREPGDFDGGHERAHIGDRPLGKVLPLSAMAGLQPIPLAGATIQYESPEIAGVVKLEISGTGPNAVVVEPYVITFHVKDGDFTRLVEPVVDGKQWLILDVQSHPTGVHGTKALSDAIPALVDEYINELKVNEVDLQAANPIESEAVSLLWGGLLDVHRRWAVPHCTHRDGSAMDISINYIESLRSYILPVEQEAIEWALIKTRHSFTKVREGNHWHVRKK